MDRIVCIWCNGTGRRERWVSRLRRRAWVTCDKCDGTGRHVFGQREAS